MLAATRAHTRFAHVWKVGDGKITSFEQIVDSVITAAAMS
jgi:ketosteroid isomerase-like protein